MLLYANLVHKEHECTHFSIARYKNILKINLILKKIFTSINTISFFVNKIGFLIINHTHTRAI
jgi:hypothetical protein